MATVRVVQIPVDMFDRLKGLASAVPISLLNQYYEWVKEEPCYYTVRGMIVPHIYGYLYTLHFVTLLLGEFETE